MKRLAPFLILALVGCASQGAQEPGAPAPRISGKADSANSERARSHLRDESRQEGLLPVGTTTIDHEGDPPYLVFEVQAQRADQIHIEATSFDVGDPILWLLTPDYAVLAKNDDSYSFSTDAEISYRAPSSGTYLVAIADVFRDPATFEITLEGTSDADPAHLDEFLALTDDEKMEALYDGSYYGYGEAPDLRADFTRVSGIVIRDEFEGAQRNAMFAAYFALRDEAHAEGGTTPDVSAIMRGGLIYAVEMSTVENNPDVEWWYTRVFDADGNDIGEQGQIGY